MSPLFWTHLKLRLQNSRLRVFWLRFWNLLIWLRSLCGKIKVLRFFLFSICWKSLRYFLLNFKLRFRKFLLRFFLLGFLYRRLIIWLCLSLGYLREIYYILLLYLFFSLFLFSLLLKSPSSLLSDSWLFLCISHCVSLLLILLLWKRLILTFGLGWVILSHWLI